MFPFTLMFDIVLFRRNPIAYLIGFSVFFLIVMMILFQTMASGKGRYGLADFGHDLGRMAGVADGDTRPALAAYLPPLPAGWARRGYMRHDGATITDSARALGRSARLRAGADLERFGLFATSGRDTAAWVLTRGAARIAFAIRRPPQLLRAGQTLSGATLPGAGAAFDAEAEIAGSGLVFARRARALPDSAAPMPYDLYRAEGPDGLIIEVLSDAPSDEVEAWLSRFELPGAPRGG